MFFDKVECDEVIRAQGFNSKLMFFQANDYKSQLIDNRCITRREVLTRNMPRFIAVVRIYANGEIKEDHLYDATAAHISLEPHAIVRY